MESPPYITLAHTRNCGALSKTYSTLSHRARCDLAGGRMRWRGQRYKLQPQAVSAVRGPAFHRVLPQGVSQQRQVRGSETPTDRIAGIRWECDIPMYAIFARLAVDFGAQSGLLSILVRAPHSLDSWFGLFLSIVYFRLKLTSIQAARVLVSLMLLSDCIVTFRCGAGCSFLPVHC